MDASIDGADKVIDSYARCSESKGCGIYRRMKGTTILLEDLDKYIDLRAGIEGCLNDRLEG